MLLRNTPICFRFFFHKLGENMSLENILLFILCLFISWSILRIFRRKKSESKKGTTPLTEKEAHILKVLEVENKEISRQEVLKISLSLKTVKINKAEFYILILKLEEKGFVIYRHITGNRFRLPQHLYSLSKKGKRALRFIDEAKF